MVGEYQLFALPEGKQTHDFSYVYLLLFDQRLESTDMFGNFPYQTLFLSNVNKVILFTVLHKMEFIG